MFTAVTPKLRDFLIQHAATFFGRTIAIHFSADFTIENALTQHAQPTAIHSHTYHLPAYLLGNLYTDQPIDIQITDPDYDFITTMWRDPTHIAASIWVLAQMLPFDDRATVYAQRYWLGYRDQFPTLVSQMAAKLTSNPPNITSVSQEPPLDRLRQFPNALHLINGANHKTRQRLKATRLHQIVGWGQPTYKADHALRAALIDQLPTVNYIYFDDRQLDHLPPIAKIEHGRRRATYCYSNTIVTPSYHRATHPASWPPIPLADQSLNLRPKSPIEIRRVKTSHIAVYKDAWLAKEIAHSPGMWGFGLFVAGAAVGFFELSPAQYGEPGVYLQSDFPIPHTTYKNISSLIVAAATSDTTRQLIERISQRRQPLIKTTAFTHRPSSMKYRGDMKKVKRGNTADGKPFLNYQTEFKTYNLKEAYLRWWNKNASKRY